MQKWLNDLYAIILKNGYSGGGGGGGSHSGVLVGKYLGDTFTDTQKTAIANGTFDGLNIGDYWIINDVTWRIADFDYYLNVGDTRFTKHHIVVVPDNILYDARMNSTDDTSNCYINSEMHTANLDNARNAFDNAFGSSFISSHRARYSLTANNGVPSSWEWVDIRVELMNDVQVLGHNVWNLNNFDLGTQKNQFRLFSLDKTKININNGYWLTTVRSSTAFLGIDRQGFVSSNTPSSNYGVRPFACIIGDPD